LVASGISSICYPAATSKSICAYSLCMAREAACKTTPTPGACSSFTDPLGCYNGTKLASGGSTANSADTLSAIGALSASLAAVFAAVLA
jgi:hypothetical protein